MRDRRYSDRSLNVRLPARLGDALARACEQQEVTVSELVRSALRKALVEPEPTPDTGDRP